MLWFPPSRRNTHPCFRICRTRSIRFTSLDDNLLASHPPSRPVLFDDHPIHLQNHLKRLFEILFDLFHALPLGIYTRNLFDPTKIPIPMFLINGSALHMDKQ